MVAHKGIYWPLEKYLHARYYMYRQVYQHRTVVAAEAMLTALMRRVRLLLNDRKSKKASETDLPPSLRGLTLPPLVIRLLRGDGEFALAEYLQLDEAMMYYAIGELRRAPDPVASDLARRVLGRSIFKSVVEENGRPGKEHVEEARALLERQRPRARLVPAPHRVERRGLCPLSPPLDTRRTSKWRCPTASSARWPR